ncbi:MAG: nuclear transport factor 2 family protein [Solirubrobacterales bacterium]
MVFALACLALAGCGVTEVVDTTIPGNAESEEAKVVEKWATALAEGDLDEAAALFAIPSEAQNGPSQIRIESRDDALLFNESLPCGVKILRIEEEGQIVTATFELTERPGAGSCGPGTGGKAKTAFRIEDGKIAEWLRVPAGGGEGGGQPLPSDVV